MVETDNLNFFIGVIIITCLIITGIVAIGSELNAKRSLNNASKTYINSFNQIEADAQTQQLSNANTKNLKEYDPITGDNSTTISSSGDVFGVMNWFSDKINFLLNPLKIAYNVPTIILRALYLPVSAFNNYINIITWVLVASLGIAIWKFLQNR